MNFCPKCGFKIEQEDKFCSNCGNSLQDSGSSADLSESKSKSKTKHKGKKISKLLVLGAVILLIIGGGGTVVVTSLFGPDISVPDDYESVQAAIKAAEKGDVIEVEPGVYEENIDFEGKKITLKSTDYKDEEVVNETVIEGKNDGPVVTFQNGEGEDTVLKGFTITGGSGEKIQLEGETVEVGGGILLLNESSPLIKHNSIKGNTAEKGGGGVFARNSQPFLKENKIMVNTTEGSGGAILTYYSKAIIESNLIRENEVGIAGGGMAVVESKNIIDDNEISDNYAADFGGGIALLESGGDIKENRIIENASVEGGGVYTEQSEVSITKNTVIENSSDNNGGGINFVDSDNLLEKNTIEENFADGDGGGIYVNDSSGNITENTITSNTGDNYGGGIYLHGPKASVENNSISENTAAVGGGIYDDRSEEAIGSNDFNGNEPDSIYVFEKCKFEHEIISLTYGTNIMNLTQQAVNIYDNLEEFEVIDSSESLMLEELFDAYENKEPVAAAGWTPHFKFAKADLKFLEDPKDVFGQEETINAIVREGLADENPDVYQFLDELFIEDEYLSEIMHYIEKIEDNVEGVKKWAEENEDLIEDWTIEADGDGEVIELGHMEWDCARAKTYTAAYILEMFMNFRVNLVEDMSQEVYSSVAAGNIDALLSSWQPVTHEVYLQDYGDDFVDLGPVYEGAKIGIIVPEYVDIDSIEEM